jgi:hypothetical protein
MNTSVVSLYSSFYYDIRNLIFNYFIPIMNIFGLILNSFCTITFLLIIKSNQRNNNSSSKMYHHLLIKSIVDFIINLIITIVFILETFDVSHKCYFSNFVYHYLYYYGVFCLNLISNSFDILATLDCAISIENKFKFIQKKFVCITVSLIICCFTFESFSLIFYRIESKIISNLNGTLIIKQYSRNFVSFLNKKTLNKLLLIDSLLRDVITLIILLLINIYILFKLIQINKNKRNIRGTTNHQQSTANNRAKYQKMKMIIYLFIVYFLGHGMLFIYYLSTKLFNVTTFNIKYLLYFGDLFSYIPLCCSFIVYFLFNNVFKNILIKKVFFIFIPFERSVEPLQTITK